MTVLKICVIWVLHISLSTRLEMSNERGNLPKLGGDVSLEEGEEHHIRDPSELSDYIGVVRIAGNQHAGQSHLEETYIKAYARDHSLPRAVAASLRTALCEWSAWASVPRMQAYLLIADPASNGLQRLFADMMKSRLEIQSAYNFANSGSYPFIRIMYTVHQFTYTISFINSSLFPAKSPSSSLLNSG